MFTTSETLAWWRRLVDDPAKMAAWLQKLHRTEFEGYSGHLEYLLKAGYNAPTDRETQILFNIAHDELTHARLLEGYMVSAGVPVLQGAAPQSEYWAYMNAQVTTFPEYCAVNHYGEALAAARFGVICGCEWTPKPLLAIFEKILPEEAFHRETLKVLAGDEALEKAKVWHDHALTLLKKGE